MYTYVLAFFYFYIYINNKIGYFVNMTSLIRADSSGHSI